MQAIAEVGAPKGKWEGMSWSASYPWISNGAEQAEQFMSGTMLDVTRSLRPIEHAGETVIFRRERMEPDRLYPFVFTGHPLVALKRQDGTLEIYYLPEE